MAYTPYVAAAVALPVLLAILTGSWRNVAAALAVAAVFGTAVLPRAVAGDQPRATGPRLRVLTANLHLGEADLDTLGALVRREEVDLLSVQELTPEADEEISAFLPFKVTRPAPGAQGTGIYSRFPLTRLPELEPPGDFWMTAARVGVTNAVTVDVLAVHPMAPWSPKVVKQWTYEVAHLPRATPGGGLRVLAGDFNATLDHAAMRTVLDSGYHDAASEVGDGFLPTWPHLHGALDKFPVTLDHVLVDKRIAVRRIAAFDLARTDHRAVLAEVTLPA